jgi:hypothetical protein
MLSFEWRELEAVVTRLDRLRHDYTAAVAYRVQHYGLVQGLKKEIAEALRVRDQLLEHISTRLSASAAHKHHAADAEHRPPDAP